jgi:hypothetical protein
LPQNLNGPVSFWWKVGGSHQPKTPTQIEVSGIPIEWFKLSILHRDDLEKDILASEKFSKSNSARERMNLTATDVTAKYLCKIWKVFLNELQKMIADAHIQITMTVPVLWPDYARKAIYDALHQANIINSNVELAPKFLAEPEAAALAIFSAAYYHVDGTPVRTNVSALGHMFMLNAPLVLQGSTWTGCNSLRLWRRYHCEFSVTLPELYCLVLIPFQGHGSLWNTLR